MNKIIFTFILISLSAPFTPTTLAAEKSIIDTLNPAKKNCQYVQSTGGAGGKYQPFSDIGTDFPALGKMLVPGRDGEKSCIDVKNGGTENLLSLLFTTAISIIIVLTVINLTVAGIQYMTEKATGKVAGGARKRLIDSIIALALGLLSYTILYTVNKQLVNFTFNPVSIDIDNSVASGVNSANIAQIGGFSSGLGGIEGVSPLLPNNPFNGGSPSGWVYALTGLPCTPATPWSLIPSTATETKDAQGRSCVRGGVSSTGNFGSWNERTTENWVRSLQGGQRSTDGRLVITIYSATRDRVTDSNTAQRRGNRNNLLREGSVALSPDLISRYRPQTGQEIFINGISIGFYEDATAESYNGVSFRNTVDIYDENGTLGGDFLKNIPSGQWTISFGRNIRPQISNP